MMLKVTIECWEKAQSKERCDLMYLVYYCYVTSETAYLESCPATFRNFPNIFAFLTESCTRMHYQLHQGGRERKKENGGL